jgi:hypothetical protein
MAVDHIRYDILAQKALRGVMRAVLVDAAKNGLPGDHHFYITFDTRAEGVRVPPRLLAQFPEEMTIVLQHQFWDLVVTDDGFEVGMSFGGVPERIGIAFDAIKSFVDPSVQFGLKFENLAESAAPAETAQGVPAPARQGDAARPPAEHQQTHPQPVTSAERKPGNPPAETPDDGPDKPAGGADVVRLDRFRKK